MTNSLEKMRASQAYYKKKLADAYKFKTQHSADYSDFTDRSDEYVQKKRYLDKAIAYLEEVEIVAEEKRKMNEGSKNKEG